jgi:hypothetical protein
MKNTLQLFVTIFLFYACKSTPVIDDSLTVSEAMDDVVTRIYNEVPAAEYGSIDDDFVLQFLLPAEKKAFATRYQYFTVNVPVRVSLMRHIDQKTIPFWLAESEFNRTQLRVKNETGYEYEVWQRDYPAGKIELGVNGFDKHRPVYFVTVAAIDTTQQLIITELFPSQYDVVTMEKGAFTYHDWSGLLLTEVPDELAGQKLLTTVRGRARESHIIGAFRNTPFPSSTNADQVVLTWSRSPSTTVDVQWRTNTTVNDGAVRYWRDSNSDTLLIEGTRNVVEDRMLFNDRYIHRFTAELDNLIAGAHYHYQVGSPKNQSWSEPKDFSTQTDNQQNFTFVWFGDTHCLPDSGKLVSLANKQNKDAAFYAIAGDVVSTGLNRDDWDKLFHFSGDVFSRKPLMPVPGNHDRQDGLGAQLYYDLFSLPKNGPEKVDSESSYSFEYGNALFLMIDATSEVSDHSAWIEEKLASSKATWKFAVFHFPPYNFEEPYLDIQEAWVPLFDKYHVDMVMGGHIHYYMRSHPMNKGKVVDAFSKGTVYAISISIPSSHDNMTNEPYAVTQFDRGYFYQRMEIKGNSLKYSAVDANGAVRDEFEIRK